LNIVDIDLVKLHVGVAAGPAHGRISSPRNKTGVGDAEAVLEANRDARIKELLGDERREFS